MPSYAIAIHAACRKREIPLPPAGNPEEDRLRSKQGLDLKNRNLRRCAMSWNFRKTSALVWLGLGLLAGLLVAGFWPSVPLHAVATDKIDTFSMATGPVESEYEAVYFLDHLTGDLHAYVIGRMVNGSVRRDPTLLSQSA